MENKALSVANQENTEALSMRQPGIDDYSQITKIDGRSPAVYNTAGYVNEIATGLDAPIQAQANANTIGISVNTTSINEIIKFRGDFDASSGDAPTLSIGQSEYWHVVKAGTIMWDNSPLLVHSGDKLYHYFDDTFEVALGFKTQNITHWASTKTDVETIPNGSSVDILDFIADTDKLPASTQSSAALSVISSTIGGVTRKVIKTNWQDTFEKLELRVTLQLDQRGTDYYRLILKRASDESIISVHPVNINAVDVPEETVTTNILTYLTGADDTYVTDGFYIEFANNSGSSVDLTKNINLLTFRNYTIPLQREAGE